MLLLEASIPRAWCSCVFVYVHVNVFVFVIVLLLCLCLRLCLCLCLLLFLRPASPLALIAASSCDIVRNAGCCRGNRL